jgi:5-methylcytosine-specific restriction endonuclease McrA
MGKRKTAPKHNSTDDVCPMDIDWDASKDVIPKKKSRKAYIPKALKMKVWDKTYGMAVGETKCLNCKLSTISQMSFHCSHIIPESEGGATNVENLVALCASCNLSMGKKNMRDFHHMYFS